MKIETIAIHGGYEPEETTKSVAVPIYQTASYAFDNTQHGADLFDLKVKGNIYTRIMNPTTEVLENRVSEIKKQTKLPIVVGFGIKDAKTARKMSLCSDGVVVGSKLVDEIGKFEPKKENILNQNLTSIISELKHGIS